MIALGCLSPPGQTQKTLVKNSMKQSIYFRENHLKTKEKRKSVEEKFSPLAPLTRLSSSLPKQNILFKTQLRIQPTNSFVRSKTEIYISQNQQKIRAPKVSPPKQLNLPNQERSKRKKTDPTLRLIAKTLVFRKSHKYYLYNKNKRGSQQIGQQRSNFVQNIPKKQDVKIQRYELDKRQRCKKTKKYKLLQMQGSKINIQQFLAMQNFNNSSIYLKSNSQCYCTE